MTAWWVDRVLPGVAASLISVTPVFVIQHFLMKRHITRVTDAQTAELKPDREGKEAA